MIGVDNNSRFFILPHNILPSHSECFHFFYFLFQAPVLSLTILRPSAKMKPLCASATPHNSYKVSVMYPCNADKRREGRGGTTTCLPRRLLPLAVLLVGRSRHSSWTARPSKMGLIVCPETLVKSQKSKDLSWRIPKLAERLLLLKL